MMDGAAVSTSGISNDRHSVGSHPDPARMPPLVSTGWLAARIGDPELVVFDCSFFLPTEKRDAQAEFAQAHLPGAQFFDIEDIADPETNLPHMVPSMGRFARLMAELGVYKDSDIVFYDCKGLFSAARGWWIMQLFGLGRAMVLDGGLPKWQAEGRAVVSGAVAARPQLPPLLTLHAGLLWGIGDMLDNVRSGNAVVLDARSAKRFAGELPEPRPGVANGHIPGARSLPHNELLAIGGTMLQPAALRTRLAFSGVDGSRPVVTTCGTGVTAAVINLALVVAGLPAAALYDGSWAEWGSRSDTPKALGADEGSSPAGELMRAEPTWAVGVEQATK